MFMECVLFSCAESMASMFECQPKSGLTSCNRWQRTQAQYWKHLLFWLMLIICVKANTMVSKYFGYFFSRNSLINICLCYYIVLVLVLYHDMVKSKETLLASDTTTTTKHNSMDSRAQYIHGRTMHYLCYITMTMITTNTYFPRNIINGNKIISFVFFGSYSWIRSLHILFSMFSMIYDDFWIFFQSKHCALRINYKINHVSL